MCWWCSLKRKVNKTILSLFWLTQSNIFEKTPLIKSKSLFKKLVLYNSVDSLFNFSIPLYSDVLKHCSMYMHMILFCLQPLMLRCVSSASSYWLCYSCAKKPIFLSKVILKYMHVWYIFSLFTLLQEKIEILYDIFKRVKKKFGNISSTDWKCRLCHYSLCSASGYKCK